MEIVSLEAELQQAEGTEATAGTEKDVAKTRYAAPSLPRSHEAESCNPLRQADGSAEKAADCVVAAQLKLAVAQSVARGLDEFLHLKALCRQVPYLHVCCCHIVYRYVAWAAFRVAFGVSRLPPCGRHRYA